ncbi:MAG: OmpH family outer membrane protein [Phycisphaerales bacterium]|jgi:Skp family chaperone for outer membrane proteins|nr:OmpH family outer membrane protein [Phycisphaerales bacterium]
MVNTTRQFYILAATVLLSLGALAWKSSATKRFEPLRPTVMAFVDIQGVFNSLEERARLFSDAEAYAEELQEEIVTRRQKITDIESEIELYKKGSEKRNELEYKQKLDSLSHNVFITCCEEKLKRFEARGIRDMYDHIRDAAKKLSQDNGWDVVFVNDAAVELPDGENTNIMGEIASRRVLYANTQFDVTDQLIEYMNAQYDEMAVR